MITASNDRCLLSPLRFLSKKYMKWEKVLADECLA